MSVAVVVALVQGERVTAASSAPEPISVRAGIGCCEHAPME